MPAKRTLDAARVRQLRLDPAIYEGTCPHGHTRTRKNTRVNTQGSRYCLECKCVANNTRPWQVTPARLRLVFERLHEGQTINELYGRHGKTYTAGACVVSYTGLRLFMQTHPRVGKRIQALGDKNRVAAYVKMGDRMRKQAAPALIRNDGADAYAAIMAATARLWEGERGDVISLMFLAAAEGRLLPRDAAARLPEFLREHRRQFGKFGPDSLDRPLFTDSGTTLGDTVVRGLWGEPFHTPGAQ